MGFLQGVLKLIVWAVVGLVGVVVALVVGAMAWEKLTEPKPNPDWTLFAYPAGLDSGAIVTPGFKSLEFCALAGRQSVRAYATSRTQSLAEGPDPTYECGYKCGYKEYWPVSVCERTVE